MFFSDAGIQAWDPTYARIALFLFLLEARGLCVSHADLKLEILLPQPFCAETTACATILSLETHILN